MTTHDDETVNRSEQGDEHDEAARAEEQELLVGQDTSRFNERWQQIQADFVDRPREAVQEADALVSDLVDQITAGFGAERERLERQWDGGDDVSTEDLRVALQRYRAFFGRLLSA
jgi:hypothetical protein